MSSISRIARRIVRPSTVGSLIVLSACLLAGCSRKEAACERAVMAKLKNPDSYRTISITEEYGEGNAFNDYIVKYSYKKGGALVSGEQYCQYDNNDEKAYTDIPEPQF